MNLSREDYADLFAVAVIASARIYEDDPVAAVTHEHGGLRDRRALNPAGAAMMAHLNWDEATVARCLGLQVRSFHASRFRRGEAFEAARIAASRAVSAAHSRMAATKASAFLSVGVMGSQGAEIVIKPKAVRTVKTGVVSMATLPKLIEVKTPPIFVPPAAPRASVLKAPALHPAGGLSDRIMKELSQRPLSANSLATILDVKEIYVINALRALSLEGKIITVTGGNESACKWHLVEAAA